MPPRKHRITLFPKRTERGRSSSSSAIHKISRTTEIRETTHDTPLFPPKKMPQKPRKFPQKKPAPKGQIRGYNKKALPEKIGLEEHEHDWKG